MRKRVPDRRSWSAVFVQALSTVVLGVMLGGVGTAQVSDEIRAEGPTVAALEAVAAEVAAITGLATEQKAELAAIYASAIDKAQLAHQWQMRRAELERDVEEAPALTEALLVDLARSVPDSQPIPVGMSVTELEQEAMQADADLAAARAEADALMAELRRREERRAELPGALADARARIEAMLDVPVAEPDAEDPAAVERARAQDLLRAARLAATAAEVAVLELEGQRTEVGKDLLSARRERAARRVTEAEVAAGAWRDATIVARQKQAEDTAVAAANAATEAATEHEGIRALAQRNADLAEDRTGDLGLIARIRDETQRLTSVRAMLERVHRDRASVRAKYEAAGKTPAIGLLLVRHREGLPDVQHHRDSVRLRRNETAEIQLGLIETRETLDGLVDIEASVAAWSAELQGKADTPVSEDIERAAHEQLSSYRELLVQVEGDYGAYADVLADLDVAETALIQEISAFADYIDERVLWVRTRPSMHADPTLVEDVVRGAVWLGDPAWWSTIGPRAQAEAVSRPVETVLPVLLVVLLLFVRAGMRHRVDEAAVIVSNLRTDAFRFTLRTLVDTFLLALPLPLLAWFIGGLMIDVAPLEPAGSHTAIGSALQVTAGFWLAITLAHRAVRKDGLVEAHFRYPVGTLRRRLGLLLVLGLPTVFLVEVFRGHGDDALGRLAFIAGELVLIWFLAGVLHPRKGILAPYVEQHPEGWLARTAWIWLLFGVGLPVVLALLVELGYVYTAEQLERRLQQTLTLVAGLALVHALFMRAVFVARRRLALQQYFKRRAAAEAEARGDAPSEGPSQDEIDEIDVAAISVQSRRLVSSLAAFALLAGVWLVWADVFPALRTLDVVEIWTHTEDVVERTSDPSGVGPDRVVVVPRSVPVTLGDAIKAAIWLLMTGIAARNLPGLLEIVILQRIPMQRAGRYATTTLSRYVIVVIGIAGAFGAVGIGWSQVQWLAAAVSVGLGFGLQEIFANMVSGLILLFERPMRVGDTVTVGDVTGTVMRIHMRATTIMTWDETELVVPNREFITNQIVNWTLSSSVLRVIVNVGIAYGSDTELATRLLHKVARRCANVLPDPAPRVVFTSFGDSTLDFELRCYVSTPDVFRRVHHDLNTAIDKVFREEHIEIAFPQRDLHLRSAEIPITLVHKREPRPPAEVADQAETPTG